MSECFKISNNKYFDSPALMNDGRAFTDYRPKCLVDYEILNKNTIKSSYEYRQFLINNGSKLMQHNTNLNYKKNNSTTCNSTPIPLESVCKIDGYTSMCENVNRKGLGQGNTTIAMPTLDYAPILQDTINSSNIGKDLDTNLMNNTNMNSINNLERFANPGNICRGKSQ
jgi:hypothetical protein